MVGWAVISCTEQTFVLGVVEAERIIWENVGQIFRPTPTAPYDLLPP